MKFLKVFFSSVVLYLLLFTGGAQFSACKKTITEHDTTTVIKHDTTTVIKHDTTTVIDTLYDLKGGILAYYNFNNGTLNDSSGKGNHITVNTNATKTADRFGNPNNAYLFDGSTSFMTVPNSASLTPTVAITLSAVFKINGFYSANCVGNQIFGKGYDDYITGFYALRFASSVGCGAVVDTSKESGFGQFGDIVGTDLASRPVLGDDTKLHTNTWYNLVYTYENGVSNFYINGVLKSTAAQTFHGSTANNLPLFIGKHGDPGYPFWFNGVIDDIRIYSRALCAGAVKQLYNIKK